jgi:glyoxylase-like metal-dependent hydrolase (beta-lactamase superfamily II)
MNGPNTPNTPVYPWDKTLPEPSQTIEMAPGVHWLRMPLPFALNHINLWLLEDGDEWVIVDTGYGVARTWELWDELFAKRLNGKPVTRIIVTHHHPDHIGSAAWLQAKTGAPIWITYSEFVAAYIVREGMGGFGRQGTIDLFEAHGVPEALIAPMRHSEGSFKGGVPELPKKFNRMMEGDRIPINGHDWEIIVTHGHAPEHATLYCKALNVLISGDQVLPRITTNVSVWGSDPEGNPLQRFLDSTHKFNHLPADVLVLPSHDRPFRGIHDRLATLRAHHDERFDVLVSACKNKACTAFELLPVLFNRALDQHQIFFAMGEAIAHLNYLNVQKRLVRSKQSNDATAPWVFKATP